MYHYRAYDLVFGSDTPVPALAQSAVTGENVVADFMVVTGSVTMPNDVTDVDGMEVAVVDGEVFMRIEDSGTYHVSGGREIIVEPAAGASQDQVMIYLLGTVFGILLYQRGLLPLHCNAVEHEGRAFLFCGDSGAGKSTLATYFQRQGFKLLTDDVCPVRFDANGIVAIPGIARVKLWRNSLDLFGLSSDGLRQLPWNVEKFELGLPAGDLGNAHPVAAIYHLRDTFEGRPHGIHRLGGLAAANSVLANIYRRRVADLMGLGGVYLGMATRIMANVPIFSVNRAWGLENFQAEAEAAEQHLRNL